MINNSLVMEKDFKYDKAFSKEELYVDIYKDTKYAIAKKIQQIFQYESMSILGFDPIAQTDLLKIELHPKIIQDDKFIIPICKFYDYSKEEPILTTGSIGEVIKEDIICLQDLIEYINTKINIFGSLSVDTMENSPIVPYEDYERLKNKKQCACMLCYKDLEEEYYV